MPLQLRKQPFSFKGNKKRRRRQGRAVFLTSGGDVGVTFKGINNLSFSNSNGYRVTLGFGGGAWYFKLWDSAGVQVGATLGRPSLAVLSAVVNANATMQNYLTMTVESGVTTVPGSSTLNFAEATPFRGGL